MKRSERAARIQKKMKKSRIFLLRASVDLNGPGRLILSTALQVLKFGWIPVVITHDVSAGTEDFKNHGIQVEFVRKNPVLLFLDLFFLAMRFRPEILHSFSYSMGICCEVLYRLKLCRISLLTINGFGNEWVLKFLKTPILVPSRYLKDRLKKNYRIETMVLYPCSPEVILGKATVPRLVDCGNGIDPKRIVLGSLVRDLDCKGIPFFLESIALMKSKGITVKGIIAGSEAERYQDLIEQLGISENVDFIGLITDIQGFFRSIDVYAQFSAYESFGISVLEAMYYGVPVVVSDIEGFKEVVGEGEKSGLYFRKGDVVNAVERIMELVSDNERYRTLMTQGRKRVDDYYSAEHFSGSLNAVYSLDMVQ